ncbi:choline/ethanolamine kinase family protein [Microbulbifer sp. YPW1]|uniref:choline/ethanolamine kinase family protein n=1 Tax=Microbulbifer sp. YPW1 TaxID=2745199 RepID=UPI001598295C|nr:choline/ethanolamine kinase family protein [Microbulbifer sp. YPW1]QKX15753.1 phosphotransferase family protein [Microbulbifer sp. YPW1]
MTLPPADFLPADWPLWSTSQPTLLKPLTLGLTNRSFLLAAGEDRLVLRLNSPISDALDLNRPAEAEALHLADTEGLCAPLVYCDPEYRYLVTRYISGTPLTLAENTGIAQIAQLLQDIHRLPPIAAQLDIEQKIASYWTSINTDDAFFESLRTLQRRVQSSIVATRNCASSPALCHNDLLADNLLISESGRLYAIDWEYAASGDPFYDLAVIAEGYDLDSAQQSHLLQQYLAQPVDNEEMARLDHWRVIYRYLSILWYAVQASNSDDHAEKQNFSAVLRREIEAIRKALSRSGH